MANTLIDLKKFRHVKSDEHTTQLAHPDGHTITLAHKSLSKPNQEQLKALSNMAANDKTAAQKQSDPSDKPGKNADVDRQDKPDTGYGKIIYKADGGDVEPPEYLKPNSDVQVDPLDTIIPNNIMDTTADALPTPQKSLFEQGAAAYAPSKDKASNEETKPTSIFNPAPDSIMGKQAGMSQEQNPDAVLNAYANAPAKAETEQPAQAAVPTPAVSQAPVPHQQASAAQPAPKQAPVQAGDGFLQEVQSVRNDFANGHITPKTTEQMYSDKNVGGKIGTLFGLLASGLGSGMSGQKNAVMEMMNQEIDRDLKAQEASKSNQLNFLNYANQHVMNDANIKHMETMDPANAANIRATTKMMTTELARNAMYADQFAKLSATANKIQDPAQKQQALQTLGVISQGMDAKMLHAKDALNAKQALYSGMMGSPAGAGNSEQDFQNDQRKLMLTGHGDLAKDNESKHMPGLLGRASVPLTSEDRTAINSGVTLDNQINRFMDWTKKHSGSLDPKTVNEGKALAAGLQGAYRNATNGGVYKASEQDFISKLINSDPTAFFNKVRVLPQLKAVADDNRNQLDQYVKSKGFTSGYQGQQQQSNDPATAVAWAKANPTDPRAVKIMQRHGTK